MARLPGARLLQGQALPRGWCGRRVGRGNRRVGGVAWRGWVGQGVGVAGGWARVSGGRGGAGCGWGGCSPSESCWPLPFLHAGRGCPAAGLASQASPRHPPPWPLPTNYLGGGGLSFLPICLASSPNPNLTPVPLLRPLPLKTRPRPSWRARSTLSSSHAPASHGCGLCRRPRPNRRARSTSSPSSSSPKGCWRCWLSAAAPAAPPSCPPAPASERLQAGHGCRARPVYSPHCF